MAQSSWTATKDLSASDMPFVATYLICFEKVCTLPISKKNNAKNQISGSKSLGNLKGIEGVANTSFWMIVFEKSIRSTIAIISNKYKIRERHDHKYCEYYQGLFHVCNTLIQWNVIF